MSYGTKEKGAGSKEDRKQNRGKLWVNCYSLLKRPGAKAVQRVCRRELRVRNKMMVQEQVT